MENKKHILITEAQDTYTGSITALYLLKNSEFSPVIVDMDPEIKYQKVLVEEGIPIFKGKIGDQRSH